MTNRAGIQKLTTSPLFVNITRRILLTTLTASALIFFACGPLLPSGYVEVRQALAPSGKLRVGVYAGSPTSMIVDPKSREKIGIALDLGRELAREIGVPVDMVEFRRIAESGFAGFEASVWYGFVAPAATPKAIVAKLHAEVQKALQTAEVRERMSSVGGEVLLGSSEMFGALIRSERARYEKLVREAQIKRD